ncbi:MAG: hypothetical protein DAHOPDDO_01198 [Ignavibacteriaceae bacterium]|nr:hypothetical protein [Ignavibacteriaceae bacterium]
MNSIKILVVLFLLFQLTYTLKAQEIHNPTKTTFYNQDKTTPLSNAVSDSLIYFHYDKIVGEFSTQIEGDFLIENLTTQDWNQSLSSWKTYSIYEYSYNNNNLADTFIVRKRNSGGVLENTYKETYSYDMNSRLSFSNEWYWSSGYWEEFYRYYYFFSSNNNLLHIDRYTWANPGWLHINRYSYGWNSLSDTTRITCEGLYMFYGQWGPFWKEEFSYDSTNLLIKKDRYDHYLLSDWKLELRDLYFYDANRNNNEIIRQEWNSTDSIWVNDFRYLYEYDLNYNLLSTIYQDWQTTILDWENVWRETYTYTQQNNIATMLKENWTPGTGWNNYVFRIYVYDENYNWTEKLTQLWDGSVWKNYFRHLATWLDPVMVEEKQLVSNSYHLFNNYPNPFNPSTVISYQLPVTGFVTLKIYDVLGNEVATLVNEEKPAGKYEVEFNATNLSSGTYFYSMIADGFSKTNKMIVIK